MEVIKSVRICDKFNLTLVRFDGYNDSMNNRGYGYEVQYSDDENILDYDGSYSNLKDGLKAFKHYLLKVLIKKI